MLPSRKRSFAAVTAVLALIGVMPFGCAAERAAAPVSQAAFVGSPEGREAEAPTEPARRGLATRLDDEPIVPIRRSHPKVGRLRGSGSLSIGTTRDGFVVDCRPLPEDEHLRMLEVPGRRGTACGTDELIDALVKAARDVAKASPGAQLTVGNMARVGGGDIIWSVSHNSGRDVDIGFYLRGEDGKQVIPPVLVHVDGRGRGEVDGVPVRFDVRRNWLLVKSLLTNPKIEVQWLFVSTGVRRLLIDHARKKREPRALIERAEAAMARPRGLPHDDHFHLRIYCAPDDLYEGCQDRGTNRPWFVDRTGRIAARVKELLALLKAGDAGARAAAVTVLGRLGRQSVLPEVVPLLGDPAAPVRIAAARALGELGIQGQVAAVEAAIERVPDDEAVLALLGAIERGLSGEARAASLGRLLRSGRTFSVSNGVFEARWTVGRWALDALVRAGGEYAVRELVAAIGRANPDAASIDRALSELTGTRAARDIQDVAGVAAAWSAWWKKNRNKPPIRWYEEALRADGLLGAGSPSPTGDPAALIDILRKADHRRRAAFEVLMAQHRGMRLPPDGMEPLPVLIERALGCATQAAEAPAHDTLDTD